MIGQSRTIKLFTGGLMSKGVVLVTGAGGYIGSVLVPKLLYAGYHVRAIDRFFFGDDKLIAHDSLKLIKDDVRKIDENLFEGVDYLIDLVAISNDPSGELFSKATWQINYESRVRHARWAKRNGVKRYILPSSCSVYGFQEKISDEESPTNPLTVYAKANEKAEKAVLPLADENFMAVVLRQSTIFGYSPRMRFDLAINGMTYGAWENKKLPLMRDGSQYRPMVHVQDTTDVMIRLLEVEEEKINGQTFNIGSEECNYQIKTLGEIVAKIVSEMIGEEVPIEWYGDPDHRNYRVSSKKIEDAINWKAKWNAERGVHEIVEKLKDRLLEKTSQTITLEWYKELTKWHKVIKNVEKYEGIVDID